MLLRLIWWGLVGILLIGFAIMDGHDLGVGALSPFVGKSDSERRAIINSITPHWDGNQVWLITAGGAIFAAWPLVYAASFSMLYIAILAVLWTIFLRPVAFEYRSKIANVNWRKTWDWVLFIASATPALLFGVAFGNLFIGVPFHFDANMRVFSDQPSIIMGFLNLLSPFTILAGLVSLSMLVAHGGTYLALRTEQQIQQRAKFAAILFSVITIIIFAAGGIYLHYINGFIAHNLDPNAPSDPLFKNVIATPGAWLNNYLSYPWLLILPSIGIVGQIFTIALNKLNKHGFAFITSAISIAGIILTAGVSLFPFILPSSSALNSSLTLWDATSTQHTLLLMLVAALIFTPIVLIYTSWVYKIMRGKLTVAKIEENSKSYY
jgi:cytochrome d ubiquinol oxidase subunit II